MLHTAISLKANVGLLQHQKSTAAWELNTVQLRKTHANKWRKHLLHCDDTRTAFRKTADTLKTQRSLLFWEQLLTEWASCGGWTPERPLFSPDDRQQTWLSQHWPSVSVTSQHQEWERSQLRDGSMWFTRWGRVCVIQHEGREEVWVSVLEDVCYITVILMSWNWWKFKNCEVNVVVSIWEKWLVTQNTESAAHWLIYSHEKLKHVFHRWNWVFVPLASQLHRVHTDTRGRSCSSLIMMWEPLTDCQQVCLTASGRESARLPSLSQHSCHDFCVMMIQSKLHLLKDTKKLKL